MGIQSIFKQFKKYYFLLFGIVILMFITSIVIVTTKYTNIENKIVEKEFSTVRNSVRFSPLEVNLINFHYINEGTLAQHISENNALNLVRWIHKYKENFNIDGGLLISKSGNLLAKTDFVKIPFSQKITDLITKSLSGELISTVETIPVSDFDEGLKFEFSKKASYSTNEAKTTSLSLLKAYPIYNKSHKIIASFITVDFINGDKKLLDKIIGNIIYDEAGIIIDNGNVVKKEFVKNSSDEISLFNKYKKDMAKEDIVDNKNRTILIPFRGFDNKINGALYVKLATNNNKESLTIFYLQNLMFLLIGIFIFIFGLKKIKRNSQQPYNKMMSIILKMSEGNFKFPLLSRFYLQSIFKEEFSALMKISKWMSKKR